MRHVDVQYKRMRLSSFRIVTLTPVPLRTLYGGYPIWVVGYEFEYSNNGWWGVNNLAEYCNGPR